MVSLAPFAREVLLIFFAFVLDWLIGVGHKSRHAVITYKCVLCCVEPLL